MLQQYKILTITHRHTRLKSIGEYVVKADSTDELRQRLQALQQRMGLDELLYLATCNRVMYLVATEQPLTTTFIHNFFAGVNPFLTAPGIEAEVQAYTGQAAVNHLFEVAASIDSLVIGERQILGQLREAYDQCQAWNLTGDNLRLLFQQAVVAAKDVYANTRIGEKPVSVVSLAVQKLLHLDLPKTARILLVGAGQTNALAAKFLKKHGFNHIAVFNRTLARAEALAAEFAHGSAHPLTELPQYNQGFDCLVACTGSSEPVVTQEIFTSLLAGDDPVGKILVDLSIPHNISHEVAQQTGATYIEIEDLRQLAQENHAFREQEVQRARHLLELHEDEFPVLCRQRQLERALSSLPAEIKAVKARAINEVFRKEMDGLTPETRDLMERMLTYMEKKCIGIPMRTAREALGATSTPGLP